MLEKAIFPFAPGNVAPAGSAKPKSATAAVTSSRATRLDVTIEAPGLKDFPLRQPPLYPLEPRSQG